MAGVGVILGIIALTTLLGLQITGLVYRHRADAAADLTAISAATVQVMAGTDEACARAGEIAASNGARLSECREVTGGSSDAPAGTVGEVGILVEVTVGGTASGGLGGSLGGARSAVAVAGP
ncbi:hypothetical protein A606_10425 [Corynebacterium terpenotabidum Y-11]|uniref:Uncharacterized protein n=1 Tax=Corynebacterium terpenotabidum Y-11 TaxID=1200352 RepID=S4XGL3_9CORY|nr:hypothetical protein A606_10425 [Corynebacterium terpenotabidum Y-11]